MLSVEEALERILSFFEVLEAEVESGNPGSLAVALAAGYEEVGRRHDGRLVMAAGTVTGAVIGWGRGV